MGWLSVMDHYFQMEEIGGPENPMLECYTSLGFLAAYTSTVQLGALGPVSPAETAHKLEVLRRHCDDAGRDSTQIRATAIYTGGHPGTPSATATLRP